MQELLQKETMGRKERIWGSWQEKHNLGMAGDEARLMRESFLLGSAAL